MRSGPKHKDDNRRRAARAPVALLIQYRFNSLDDFSPDYSLDISPTGMFIHTHEPKPLGTMIELQFCMKDGSQLIEGSGRVARVILPNSDGRAPGMGIEFVGLKDEARFLLERICATKLK